MSRPKLPHPPKSDTERSRAFIDRIEKTGGRQLRCAIRGPANKALEIVMAARGFSAVTEAVETILIEEVERLVANGKISVDINAKHHHNASVDQRNGENEMPELNAIEGGYEKTMDNFFQALLDENWDEAQRIKEEQILPRQQKKAKLKVAR